MQAVATRATWSGITLNWPVDGGGRLPVELSGLPSSMLRGISSAIAALASAAISTPWRGSPPCRRNELFGETAAPQETSAATSAEPTSAASPSSDELPEPIAAKTSSLPRLLLPRLHIKPIWKRPWNLQGSRI